jgi:hypothetical protein
VADGIELLKLYQRKSASGRTWFSGRLGGARVVVLKDDNATVDGDTVAVWSVLVRHRDPDRAINNWNDRPTPAPDRQASAQAPARQKARPASGKQPSAQQKAAIDDVNARYKSDLNDDLPLDL